MSECEKQLVAKRDKFPIIWLITATIVGWFMSLAFSPVGGGANMSYISKKIRPISEVVSKEPGKKTNEAKHFNTMGVRGNVTQYVDIGYSDSARLVTSRENVYIGGSVSPNSRAHASVRPQAQHGTDINKGAFQIAVNYMSVPEENFFGYEYLPNGEFTESWWSRFWGGVAEGTADTLANTHWAIKSLISKEAAEKSPEERAVLNRTSNFIIRRVQKYLDYVAQLEPLPQSRMGEIFGNIGSSVFSPIATSAPLLFFDLFEMASIMPYGVNSAILKCEMAIWFLCFSCFVAAIPIVIVWFFNKRNKIPLYILTVMGMCFGICWIVALIGAVFEKRKSDDFVIYV